MTNPTKARPKSWSDEIRMAGSLTNMLKKRQFLSVDEKRYLSTFLAPIDRHEHA
jgi:hypothetical protein